MYVLFTVCITRKIITNRQIPPFLNFKTIHVFYKKLHETRKPSSEVLEISMGDSERQQQLLADGWIGTGILQKDDNWYVTYEENKDYI